MRRLERHWCPTVFDPRGLVLVDATDTSGKYSGLDLVYDVGRHRAVRWVTRLP